MISCFSVLCVLRSKHPSMKHKNWKSPEIAEYMPDPKK